MPELTKFQKFVADYGHARLARELGVQRQAVGAWASGRTRPDPSRVEAIVAAAKADGVKLTAVDIYPQQGATS